MVHVYGLSDSAAEHVAAAAKIATEVLAPNAAAVDAQAEFPAVSMDA